MVYILDTNIFRKLLDHFPKKGVYFKQVWQAFENGIQKGIYQSVDECYNELSARYDDKNDNMQWLKANKKMFLAPTNEESQIIRVLFQNPKMQITLKQHHLHGVLAPP